MASPDRYTIKSWTVYGEGPIPEKGFKTGDTLFIERLEADRACKLSWPDGSIESLRFDIPEQVVVASFGPQSVKCLVRVESTDTGITGTLTWITNGANDGNTGTFAADAHPGIDGSS